jgi:multiple sugar transport system permease protein
VTKVVDKVKNLYNKAKNSTSEARYKTLLKASGVLTAAFRYLVLITVGYIVLYPLLYMISSAIRTRDSFFDPSIIWITSEVTWENFDIARRIMHYESAFINTIIYELVAAFIQILSCSLVAYGLARFEFKEKKILTFFMFLLILVPPQMIMLPTRTTYAELDVLGILGLVNNLTGIDLRPNILNSLWTFYLPALFGVGIRAGIIIYIYVQFFKGLPKELEEASWIDGAGPLKTYLRIALPSSSVVIMTVTVFSVIWHWNDYSLASMYLYADGWPLAVRLSEITSAESIGTLYIKFGPENPESVAIVMAGCLMFIVPVLIMYMFLQKKFVKSIDRVGITG